MTPGLPDGIDVNSLAIDPGATIYAATSSGVLRSTHGGSNWSAMNFGLGMIGVNVLAFDPQNAGTLYAGTPGAGVFAITTASSPSSEAAIGIQ